MSYVEMPPGRYLSATVGVSPHAGGQTRATLMRNRVFVREAGITSSILTFGKDQDLDKQREELLEHGMLIDGLPMLNIYEHFRDSGWGEAVSSGELPEDLGKYKTREESHADGTPWRISYAVPDSRHRRIYDHLRPDGSPFLRIPSFQHGEPGTWPDRLLQLGKRGEIVGQLGSVGEWYRQWVRDLTVDDERAFVFMDSRRIVPHLVPMDEQHVYLINLMHSLHIKRPRRWNSPMGETYRQVLRRINGLDAMVNLTDRQRKDIAQRRGSTSNMFVVPNPVDLPDLPTEPPPRDPHQITVVARLSAGKRLPQAVAVLDRVLRSVPEAHLEIYGEGPARPHIESEIAKRGLGDKVTLHGYDPRAREALWRSSVFLLTTAIEGYPLSTLEAMSRGCPVVSYDIKYGPREQITDGVDGFLVPSADVAGGAARVIELLRSPELVQRMSVAARKKAEQHGYAEFLKDWSRVVQAVIDRKPYRTKLNNVDFELTRFRIRPGGHGLRRLLHVRRRVGERPVTSDSDVELTAKLDVEGRSPRSTLDSAQLSLTAVDDKTGGVTELPIDWTLHNNQLVIRSHFKGADWLVADGVRAETARLRLRFTWENSSWNTVIRRQQPADPRQGS